MGTLEPPFVSHNRNTQSGISGSDFREYFIDFKNQPFNISIIYPNPIKVNLMTFFFCFKSNCPFLTEVVMAANAVTQM